MITTFFGRLLYDYIIEDDGRLRESFPFIDLQSKTSFPISNQLLDNILSFCAPIGAGVGGAITNTCLTYALAGFQATLVGRCGADWEGYQAIARLENLGVRKPRIQASDHETGRCVILTSERQEKKRRILYNLGVSGYIDSEHVAFAACRNEARRIVVEAQMLLDNNSMRQAWRTLELHNVYSEKIITLHGVPQWRARDVERLIGVCDVIVGNDVEHHAFSGGCELPAKCLLITTKGRDGVSWQHGSEKGFCPALSIAPADFKNNLGAGDGFLAGFLIGRDLFLQTADAVALGVRVAALVCGEIGGNVEERSKIAALV